MSERLMRLLSELPPAAPDPAQAERIRIRCRARLARQAASARAEGVPGPPRKTAQVWSSMIAVLGVAYLTEVITQALRLYRLP
jgi:hypothetical protein